MNSNKSRFIRTVIIALFTLGSTCFAGQAKYIFLCIGDGMGTSQRIATQKYYETINKGTTQSSTLINTFPVQGLTTTFSYDAVATDSSAAATALACGQKTRNKVVAMDINKEKPLESLSEKADKAGMKVGVVTSVAINHATPSAFYAHQASRYSYYDIAMSMGKTGFEYFAGGNPLKCSENYLKGRKSPIQDLKEHGYKIVKTREELNALEKGCDKVFVYNENTEHMCGLQYDIDRSNKDLTLAEFTEKGIELLENPNGFFMMIEGGRIDWSCHSNDAATVVREVKAFDDAVRKAYAFYEKHPDETLIVVTGDHETGGMRFNSSSSNTLESAHLLSAQNQSIVNFTLDYKKFKKAKPTFEQTLAMAKDKLGLDNLSESERETLRKAYESSFNESGPKNTILYGVYDPMCIAAIHMLSKKAGIEWTSFSHTGVPVTTTAIGVDSEIFKGFYDNTDLSNKIAKIIAKNKVLAKK